MNTSGINDFNYYCNLTENILTGGAIFPVVGTAFAACKLTLGILQTITALALGILSTPFRFCSDGGAAFNDHCWAHVIHGFGNIVASLGEAIPILSAVIFYHRLSGYGTVTNATQINAEHQEKYIPYSDLIILDSNKLGRPVAREHLFTNKISCLSPTRFRAFINFNVVSSPLA